MLETESDWLKNQWSYGLRALYCVPLVIGEALLSKTPYVAHLKTSLRRQVVLLLLLSPAFNVVFNFGLIFGAANLI